MLLQCGEFYEVIYFVDASVIGCEADCSTCSHNRLICDG